MPAPLACVLLTQLLHLLNEPVIQYPINAIADWIWLTLFVYFIFRFLKINQYGLRLYYHNLNFIWVMALLLCWKIETQNTTGFSVLKILQPVDSSSRFRKKVYLEISMLSSVKCSSTVVGNTMVSDCVMLHRELSFSTWKLDEVPEHSKRQFVTSSFLLR